MELNIIKFDKKFINCDIHGNSEAMLNGKCYSCYKNLQEKEINKEYQQKKLVIKREINVPARYFDATFDTYIPDNDKSIKIKHLCEDYNYDKNLILVGGVGVGKTHLVCAMIDKAMDKHKKCYYAPFYKLADIKIKDPITYKLILNVDLLVIDEYGVQDSDFKNNLLFEIINERYNNMVYTVIVSNLSLKIFKENLGDPAYSRLKQNVITAEANWQDYRKKVK
jgi:DNA replication protein DnaC